MTATREPHDDGTHQGTGRPMPEDGLKEAASNGEGTARRRILTAGLGAAPVLLTLAGRPAFAQTFAPSAAESMATCMSLGAGNPDCIRGESLTTLSARYLPRPAPAMGGSARERPQETSGPRALTLTSTNEAASGRWDIYNDAFLESYSGPRFTAVFGAPWGPRGGPDAWQGDERFGDVLAMNPSRDPGNLGKNLIGAYEAAMKGDFIMDAAEVVNMGRSAITGRLYPLPPPSRARWNRDNVIRYLQNVIAP